MEFTLENFEDEIDGTILSRGMSYYHDGAVIHLEEADTDVWEAIVRGSRKYDVEIIVEEGEVVSAECDCPYDWGGPCKHIVATLFAIRDGQPTAQMDASSKGHDPKLTPVREEQMKRVELVMAGLSREEIQSFLQAHLVGDDDLRLHFLMRYEQQEQFSEPKDIIAYLESRLALGQSASYRIGKGFVDTLLAKLEEFLLLADGRLSKGDRVAAVKIIQACTLTTCRVRNLGAHASEDLKTLFERGLMGLSAVAEDRSNDPETRQAMLDACEEIGKLNSGLDQTLRQQLFRTAELCGRLEIDGKRIVSLYDSLRLGPDAFEARLALERRWLGEEAEWAYLMSHLGQDAYRAIAIERNIQAKNYVEAHRLALEGLGDQKGYFGYHGLRWLKDLVRIAYLQGKVEVAIAYGKRLFVEDGRDRMETYQFLKGIFLADAWPQISEMLLKAQGTHYHPSSAFLAAVYAEEGWNDRLLEILKKSMNPELIRLHQQRFLPAYHAELLALWERVLVEHLQHCENRKAYEAACSYLRQIRSLGGQDVFDYMCKFIREEFKRKSTFMQLLNQL